MKLVSILRGVIIFLGASLLISIQAFEARAGIFSSPQELLVKAATKGDIELAQRAIAKGADVNGRVQYLGDNTWTALLIVTYEGRIREVGKETQKKLMQNYTQLTARLLETGANVNVKNSYGITPLMNAVGNVEILKSLLDCSADLYATDNNGMTALSYAVQQGREHSAMLLIDHGADINVNTSDGENLLILAASSGSLSLIEYFIKQGLDVNVATPRGDTPLTRAIEQGQPEIAERLLESGAKANIKTFSDEQTPLMKAAAFGYSDVARFLNTPDIVELLIEHGADVNAKSKRGTTALMFAAEKGHLETAKVLLEHNANISSTDKFGQNALWWNIHGTCKPEFIQLLHEHGADTAGAACED